MSAADPLLAPMQGAERREIGGVRLDIVRAGAGRVKRVVYPPGFRWSAQMKAIVGGDLCMHAHVGFLARGQVHVQYADGCVQEFNAPQVVAIEAPEVLKAYERRLVLVRPDGHVAWRADTEPADAYAIIDRVRGVTA